MGQTVADPRLDVPRKSVAATLRTGEGDRKWLAEDMKREQGEVFGRVLELARVTKQQASDAMGYPDQSAVSRWISGAERVQWDKVAGVRALRSLIPVAWGEVTGAELQITVVVRRTA
jgi:hypothetical protein